MAGVEALSERETHSTRSFLLQLTPKEIGIGKRVDNTHPIFPYHIRVGEIHKIGGLLLTSHHICHETQSAELIFRETHCGEHSICIDELRLEDNVLKIGSKGEAVFRKIKGENGDIIMLQMSLLRDITIDMVNPKNRQDSFL